MAHDRAREIRNFVLVSALFVVGVGAAAHFSSCADRELIHPEQE